MSGFTLAREKTSVAKTGISTSVPNDARARLMYYFSCICSVLQLENSEGQAKFRNYSTYQEIRTLGEKKALLALCALLRPDLLEGKCIFNLETLDCGNEFFDITNSTTVFNASESVLIGGQRTRVNKIMAYKSSWMNRNFLEPFKELHQEVQLIESFARMAIASGNTSQQCTIL